MMNVWQQFITISSTDPDDARRRQLLNIVLVGLFGLDIIGLIINTYSFFVDVGGVSGDILFLYVLYFILLVVIAGLYLLNRYRSGRLAGILLVAILLVTSVFSDTPAEVVDGRALIVFALPVVLASVFLPPSAAFIFAGLGSAAMFVLARSVPGLLPNLPALVILFAIALVSWLSGHGLEQALRDLRNLNRDLDQRVQDRTGELREALLREQAEASRMEATLQSIADGVIVFNDIGIAIVANPAIGALLGKSMQQVVGQNIEKLMSPSVTPGDQVAIHALFNTAATSPAPLSIDWGDKTMSISVAPVRIETGEVTGSVAVFRDVTHEAEVSRMKSAFVSIVSHEMRTPLGAIQGYTEILQQNVYGLLNEKQTEVVERIIASARRLLHIVNDLLDQARIEAGTLAISYAEFSPVKLMDGVRQEAALIAHARSLQLNTTIDAGLPEALVGDPQRLSQILINLAINAIKFTEQGSVSIRFYQLDPGQWALEVSDTGPGIPLSAQAYIFEPFRQVDSSVGRQHGGVGLGLSIVKKLAILMNGNIQLASEVGRGSTFTVTLPLLLPEPTLRPNFQTPV